MSVVSLPPQRRQINCGLIGVGVVGSAVLDFFAKGPLELKLSGAGLGGPASVPIHLWSASRSRRRKAGAADESLIRRVLDQAGGEGDRFFYDYDPGDPTSSFTPGAPAWRKIVCDPNVDIVIEVTGSPVAEAIIQEALWNGKHVVTANKRVISRSGYELVKLAQARGAVLAYEASVGGGMPIVQMLGTSIGGRVNSILAIINGTTNFMLSLMRGSSSGPEKAWAAYPSALCAAAHAGLAEADPSDDVLGEDPRSKIIILSGLAFGVRLRPRDIYVRGIARKGRRTLPAGVPRAAFHACAANGQPCKELCASDDHLATESIFTAADLQTLQGLGYVPKLLAGAQRVEAHGAERVIAWVQPCAVPASHPLAGVDGSQNACLMQVESPVTAGPESARAYEIMVRGPGAGGPETASSVIADIQFCAAQLAVAGMRRSDRLGEGPVPVYNYGANAFSRSQEFLGEPSLLAQDALLAPFLLRLAPRGDAEGPSADALAQAFGAAGLEARGLKGDGSAGGLYFLTAPVHVRAVEAALERLLRESGAKLSLDVLYLPLIEGAGLASLPSAVPARARTRP